MKTPQPISLHNARILFVTKLLLMLALCLVIRPLPAQDAKEPQKLREIFVPESELDAILEGCSGHILLDRTEFETLAAQAKKLAEEKTKALQSAKPTGPPGIEHVLLSSRHEVRILGERALVNSKMIYETFSGDLIIVPLAIDRVSLRDATLDDKPARIGNANQTVPIQQHTLFVTGKGKHELKLASLTPVTRDSTRQELRFRLPKGAVSTLQVEIPGDVDLLSGASLVKRTLEGEAADRKTVFELLHNSEDVHLIFSLNSHKTRDVRTVLARSVQFQEVTSHYSRIHATVSLDVLFRPIDSAKFSVPDSYEISDVRCEQLNRWKMNGRTLEVEFRTPVTGQVAIHISATHDTPEAFHEWSFSYLQPLEVDANSAVVGLLVDKDLELSQMDTEDLFPIDTRILLGAIPPSVFEVAPGAPVIRAVSAWYAPKGTWTVLAKMFHHPGEINVTTNLVLDLQEQTRTLQGAFLVTPFSEKLFSATIAVPEHWQLRKVTDSGDTALEFDPTVPETLAVQEVTETNYRYYKVRFKRGVAPGETFRILFEMQGESSDWFGPWTQKTVAFPRVYLLGATRNEGTIAVNADEDWTVIPMQNDRLIPLTDAEKTKVLGGVVSRMAFRYPDHHYRLELALEKDEPRIKARTYSFYRLEPSLLSMHFELCYTVEEAKTKTLSFLLPEEISEKPTIQPRSSGVVPIRIKESTSEIIEVQGKKFRRWSVQLAQAQAGELWLLVDVEHKISEGQPFEKEKVQLPRIFAADVPWHAGLLAVEGHEELNLSGISTQQLRSVDLGELSPAQYAVGARVFGAFRVPENDEPITLEMQRNPGYVLTPSVIQSASATVQIGADRGTLHNVNYVLKTKGTYLKIELRDHEELWSLQLDGQNVKAQRIGEELIVDIPAKDDALTRNLEMIFSASFNGEKPDGELLSESEVRIPRLYVPLDEKSSQKSPEADSLLSWKPVPMTKYDLHIAPPKGYEITKLGEEPLRRPVPRAAIYDVANVFLKKFSDYNPFVARAAARHVARSDRPEYLAFTLDSAQEAAAATEQKSEELPKKSQMTTRQPVSDMPAAPAGEMARQRDDKSEPLQRKSQRGLSGKRLESAQPVSIALQKDGVLGSATIKRSGIGYGETLAMPVQMIQKRVFTVTEALVWLGVFFVILCLLKSTVWRKTVFILVLVTLGTLLIAIPGLESCAAAINALVYAAFYCALPVFLFVGVLRLFANLCRKVHQCRGKCFLSRKCEPASSISTALLLFATIVSWNVFFANAETLHAQEKRFIIEENEEPLRWDEDVIVIPYNPLKIGEGTLPETTQLKNGSKMILVPRKMYQEFWDTVHAKETDGTKKPAPPIPYAFAGAKYKATLDNSTAQQLSEPVAAQGDADERQWAETLLIEGVYTFEIYTDDPVVVPLFLDGGAIDSATLDGKAAQLGFGQANLVTTRNVPNQNAVSQPFYQLTVQGKGTHELNIKARFRVQRQGGWKRVSGRFPVVPGSAVDLYVTQKQTELYIIHALEQRKFESQSDGERIETTLDPNGGFQWQWREKISEGQVDHALTANSLAQFDVQEDGLQLMWNVTLSLRGGSYESFRFRIPYGYTLCAVEGSNVRGWVPVEGVQDEQSDPLIDVELLKAADATEKISFVFRKNVTFPQGQTFDSELPKLQVLEAAMHHGIVSIRRSPQLEVKATRTLGAVQTDVPDANLFANAKIEKLSVAESPFGIRSFHAYRFTSESFQLGFSVTPLSAKNQAAIATALKLSEFGCRMETRVQFQTRHLPLYQAKVLLPSNLDLHTVTMDVPFEWSKSFEDGNQYLSVFMSEGIRDVSTLSFEGNLKQQSQEQEGPGEASETAPELRLLKPLKNAEIPYLKVLDMETSEQTFFALLDPAFDIERKDWENLVTRNVNSNSLGLLNPRQSSFVRIAFALENRDKKYGGTLTLTPRTPEVTCDTITNVNLQSQQLEETIMLEYKISRSGIRKLEFLLPYWMKDAKIDVPMLQLKRIEPLRENDAQSPLKVTLTLQDDVMNELRVLVRNERLLQPEKDSRIAAIENLTGTTARQYVVFENRLGLDELLVDAEKLGDFRRLEREDPEWAHLASVLGQGAIEAYVLRADGENRKSVSVTKNGEFPQITFKTHQRETVALSKASIGLAETRLVFSQGGDYVAEQIYRIDNRTEQFLDLLLPHDSELWVVRGLTTQEWDSRTATGTANAAGTPIKPSLLSEADIKAYQAGAKIKGIAKAAERDFVRIPLMKSELGDLDRIVRIVYAGKRERLQSFRNYEFPIVKVLNIPVESSSVRLGLPAGYRFEFDGTLHLANADALRQQEESYNRKLFERLESVSESSNIFEQLRARNNLNMFGKEYGQDGRYSFSPSSEEPQFATFDTSPMVSGSGMQGQSFEKNNVKSLEGRFASQQNTRSKNRVTQLGSNVIDERRREEYASTDFDMSTKSKKTSGFQSNWLSQSGLENTKALPTAGKQELSESLPELQMDNLAVSGKEKNQSGSNRNLSLANGQLVFDNTEVEAEELSESRDSEEEDFYAREKALAGSGNQALRRAGRSSSSSSGSTTKDEAGFDDFFASKVVQQQQVQSGQRRSGQYQPGADSWQPGQGTAGPGGGRGGARAGFVPQQAQPAQDVSAWVGIGNRPTGQLDSYNQYVAPNTNDAVVQYQAKLAESNRSVQRPMPNPSPEAARSSGGVYFDSIVDADSDPFSSDEEPEDSFRFEMAEADAVRLEPLAGSFPMRGEGRPSSQVARAEQSQSRGMSGSGSSSAFGVMGGMGSMSGGGMAGGAGMGGDNVVIGMSSPGVFSGTLDAPAGQFAMMSRVFSSLDVEVPEPGEGYLDYYFTTPQGEVELSAYCVSVEGASRFRELSRALGTIAGFWALFACVAFLARKRKTRKADAV